MNALGQMASTSSVITSKAANSCQLKTGTRKRVQGLRLFYPAASCGGKSVLVRQLRGLHLSTCPCSKRSSMALTAAALDAVDGIRSARAKGCGSSTILLFRSAQVFLPF